MKALIGYYRTMWIIRYFEERVEALFAQGRIGGTTHTGAGQEAVAVGACAALDDGDYVTSTHRGHGHLLARGGDPKRIMAELFGKASGYSGGRGGSQLMADRCLGFLGSNGITGAGLPVAVGAALSSVYRKTGRIALCFFGDGASNQGTFHESLNLAAIWSLPVVFVCENNLYAMSTPVSQSLPVPDIAVRAAGYAIPGRVVDGNDVLAVRDAVAEAGGRARRGGGPSLIECKTYRFSGHSRGDPRLYRTREEEAAWQKRDPLICCKKQLRRLGAWTADDDRALKREARRVVAGAVLAARQSPFPDPATLEEGLFA